MLRQLKYDLDTSLLFRPAIMLALHLIAAFSLPSLEYTLETHVPFLGTAADVLRTEPGTAQLVMATLAGALMTVISVVYSILLVALSLASMQFSTRILANFTKDPVSRTVMGLFIGAFAYCLAMLRAIHTDPPYVPAFSVTLGIGLGLLCLGALVLFINHIITSIQANRIVDRIAQETEHVIHDVFPSQATTAPLAAPPSGQGHPLFARCSGYIQLIDITGLQQHAAGRSLHFLRPTGSFVAQGVPIAMVWGAVDANWENHFFEHLDIGPERTMQEDAEFGIRQIVDIALKAISPAVNDPSTAATCIDHLGRLLILCAKRQMPPTYFPVSQGTLMVPNTCFSDILDLSIEQIRQYGRSDMAVCLRLMRILAETAPFLQTPVDAKRMLFHAKLILKGAEDAFSTDDCSVLQQRYTQMHHALQKHLS